MEQLLKNIMAEVWWVQVLMAFLALLIPGFLLYVVGNLIYGIYTIVRPAKTGLATEARGPDVSLEPVPGETGEALVARMQAFAEQERARLGLLPVNDTLPTEGFWINAFYIGRKIVGVLLIGLGSLLLYEMATMLSAKDMTYKVVFGMGGCAVGLIIGGILCLIAKKGEKAFKE